MSELAFNANGDTFDIPATVTGWRVRRMKPRGAPELVYGRDGRPLTVPVESEIEDLREAVGTAGKYRLDPINDDGKCVEGVPPAYVQVVKPERTAESAVATVSHGASDDTLREAMRLNTELARSVIDRFPEMMHAAAELLRAADGAGLPARKPREVEDEEEENNDEDDAPGASTTSPTFELINSLVAQVIPLVVTGLTSKKMPSLGAILDWRKAAPERVAPQPQTGPEPTQPADGSIGLPPLSPVAMAHFLAIQSALKPDEAALARAVATELAPAQLREWFDELSKLGVPDAVTKIRALIASRGTNGSPS